MSSKGRKTAGEVEDKSWHQQKFVNVVRVINAHVQIHGEGWEREKVGKHSKNNGREKLDSSRNIKIILILFFHLLSPRRNPI
jgi:hypothetical protein